MQHRVSYAWVDYTINTLGRNKMAFILQTTFSNWFIGWWRLVYLYSNLTKNVPRIRLTIGQHWIRWWTGDEVATSRYLNQRWSRLFMSHYSDVIMGVMASQITSVSIVCSAVCSGADKRKHQSSASLALARGICRWPVDSPHKGPVTRKMILFDDVIMIWHQWVKKKGCQHHRYLHEYLLRLCANVDISLVHYGICEMDILL